MKVTLQQQSVSSIRRKQKGKEEGLYTFIDAIVSIVVIVVIVVVILCIVFNFLPTLLFDDYPFSVYE